MPNVVVDLWFDAMNDLFVVDLQSGMMNNQFVVNLRSDTRNEIFVVDLWFDTMNDSFVVIFQFVVQKFVENLTSWLSNLFALYRKRNGFGQAIGRSAES